MKPFELLSSLSEITYPYPAAQNVIRVVQQGGQMDRLVIARQWLSEGIPFAFRGCPVVYESMRTWLGGQLGVEAKQISLTGSARLGSSLSQRKLGEPFGPSSDLDLFVVSKKLFTAMCDEFRRWSSDFRNGKILPITHAEERYWPENDRIGHNNIRKRGLLDSWMVPNRGGYGMFQKINSKLWMLHEKLKATACAPDVRSVSLRSYESWTCYERQVSMTLRRGANKLTNQQKRC